MPLIDGERALGAALERFGAERLFYADRHPKALGYELFARHAYDRLVELDLVRGAPLADGELRTATDRRGTLRATAGAPGEPPVIEIAGEEPGRPVVVLVSRDVGGPRARIGETELPLRADELFHRSAQHADLRATVDARGNARVPLAGAFPSEAWAEMRGLRLRVAYVVRQREGSAHVRGASEAIVVEVR